MLDLSSDAVIRRLRSGIIQGVKLHHGECRPDACHCPWRVRETAVAAYLQRMECSV
jgi:hypothetical protein